MPSSLPDATVLTVYPKDDRFFPPFTTAQVISALLIAGGIYLMRRTTARVRAPAHALAAPVQPS